MNPRRYTNWIRYKMGIRKHIMGLRLTSTWKCNSRCVTCAIWQDENAGKNDLTVEEIDTFSRSKHFKKTEYITLSGGEPTLREDLVDLISVLHKNIPTAKIGITTHGMNPDHTEKVFRSILKKNPNIRFGLVGLSLNGPPEIHDETRGIPGAWAKTIETYDRIKDLVPCQFSFTFCKQNADYFEWTQNFAKEKGTRAYICWTVMNERFQVSDKDLMFWKPGMEKVLEKYVQETLSAPKTFLSKLIGLLTLHPSISFGCLYDSTVNKRIMPCFAGSQIVHIDPAGNVYPCNFKLSKDRILGNLRKEKFDTIWERTPAKILNEIKCGECMYPNGLCGDSDIYPSLSNCPPFIFNWYLPKLFKNKPLIEAPKE